MQMVTVTGWGVDSKKSNLILKCMVILKDSPDFPLKIVHCFGWCNIMTPVKGSKDYHFELGSPKRLDSELLDTPSLHVSLVRLMEEIRLTTWDGAQTL